jgi:ABC-type transporter Mla subunit MlaD
MAERKPNSRFSNAEIKAGVFLTFCLALFIAMLFVLGKFGRIWRGRQEIQVAFTRVNAVRPESPVKYNGMEIGHVRQVAITRVDDAMLSKLPPISRRDLRNIPLSELERDQLESLNEESIDGAARKLIANRMMVTLTLDVLGENDSQRFHTDDEYRIDVSLVGDSSVEIRTGNGPSISRNYDKVLLGVSGDMYTDLGKSIAQVKDILASMAEMVGGDAGRMSIQGQLGNFDQFTDRLDAVSKSMMEDLPEAWDSTDKRILSMKETIQDGAQKVAELKPKVHDQLDNARKSIEDLRKNSAETVDAAQEKITTYRKDVRANTEEWGKLVAEYKDVIPQQVHDARTWTDRFIPTVDKIDGFVTRSNTQLIDNIENVRTQLHEYFGYAATFEAVTYRLKSWPWTLSQTPEEATAQFQDAIWRKDLAQRNYNELRGEILRVRQSLSGADTAEKSRLSRIDEAIRESDIFFESTRAPAAAPEQPASNKKDKKK